MPAVKDLTPDQNARRKAVAIAKWEGDDKYSWALFVAGRVAYSGMDKTEATYRRNRYIVKGEL